MSLRRVLLSLPLLLAPLALACGPSEEIEIDVAAAPPPLVISGRYDVSGLTTTPGSAEKRKIKGTVILVQRGDRYTATYDLKTTWPAEGVDTDADVVGVGEGTILDGTLRGDARTQLVISSIPGVDTGFAFVPRMVTTRIASSSLARIAADGSIEIEIENHPDEGEDYEPTLTRLLGQRVDSDGGELITEGD